MNIFGYEFKKKSVEHTNQNTLCTPTQRLIDVNSLIPLFSPKVCDYNFVNLFHSIVEIYHPINLIVNRCLNAKVTLKRFKDESDVWDNKKINKFLDQPNPMLSFDQFISVILSYYLVTGNTYITSNIGNYKTNERWKYADNYYPIPSHKVDIKLKNNGIVNAFSFSYISELIQSYDVVYNGQYISFPPESVLQIKEMNLEFDRDTMKGKSKLTGCVKPISNLIAQYEARNIIFVKRGALGAIVSRDKDDFGPVAYTEKEKKDIRKQMYDSYGVTGDKDTLMILDRPSDFIRFNMSIQELQPYEEYQSDIIAIASAYQIPRDMAITKDKSTYNNQLSSEKSLYENCVIPLMNKIMKDLTNWMGLNFSGFYLNADFSHIPCMQDNRKEQASTMKLNSESYSNLYDKNVITYNEMRLGLGYEIIPGMDKFKNEIEKDNGTN